MLKVAKIAHAGVVVSTDDIRCFMDPVFESPYENGVNALDPAVEIDVDELLAGSNLIVLSHEHMDHFSPRTLATFPRSIPVIYPRGAALIERALDRLGFDNRVVAEVGEQIEVGATTLMPTPSRAPFPEVGMVFKSADRVFWNLVDSVIDEAAIGVVRRMIGSPDLLFTAYQPLLEFMFDASVALEFPYEEYAKMLRFVWAIKPRHVGLIASGFRYTLPWLNDRGFPITEAQFMADLRRGAPDLPVVHVPHGGVVDIDRDCAVELDSLPGVKRTGPLFTPYDWRPERGFPPLSDRNTFGYELGMLRVEVARYLDAEFLPRLQAVDPAWLDRMERVDVVWRLEVIFPDGTNDVRLLDLVAARPLAWRSNDPQAFAKIHTSITASGLIAMLRGRHNSYSFMFNEIRVMHRLYEVQVNGAFKSGSGADEPLAKIALYEINQRYLEAELDRVLAE